MPLAPNDAIRISAADLHTIAELVTMRFPLRGPEARRVARVRGLITAACELHRVLGSYTQQALGHVRRAGGTSDLAADTQALDDALRAFGAEVDAVAREYHDAVNRPRVHPDEQVEIASHGLGDFMPWHLPTDGLASV